MTPHLISHYLLNKSYATQSKEYKIQTSYLKHCMQGLQNVIRRVVGMLVVMVVMVVMVVLVNSSTRVGCTTNLETVIITMQTP